MIAEVKECRICGGTLTRLLDLGEQKIATHFSAVCDQASYPLLLAVCIKCEAVQLYHTMHPENLFRRYWYRSGVNLSMVENLRGIVAQAMEWVDLTPDDWVVDIGSNDWTLLRQYPPEVRKVGFEPSTIPLDLKPPQHAVLVNDFFSADHFLGKAKVVTAIAMFYDLDNPREFLEHVKRILDADGVFILELSYFPLMAHQNAFDAICHEHIFYYSLRVLDQLLHECGFGIEHAEVNSTNGGSIRIFARLGSSRLHLDPMRFLVARYEDSSAISLGCRFRERVLDLRERLVTLVRGLREKDMATMHLLGASTKGNVLLQYCDFGPEIFFKAEEKSPSKFGAFTATGIPICPEQDLGPQRDIDVPDIKMVLPWHFLPTILENQQGYLQGGGAILVPLPHPLMINARNQKGALACFHQSLGLPGDEVREQSNTTG